MERSSSVTLLLMILWALVAPAQAESVTYYVPVAQDVVRAVNDDPGGSGPRIVDCQSKNSRDPLGCIIAAEKIKIGSKRRLASKKK